MLIEIRVISSTSSKSIQTKQSIISYYDATLGYQITQKNAIHTPLVKIMGEKNKRNNWDANKHSLLFFRIKV